MKKAFEASVQTIHFLLKNFGPMDKLKIVKLIYFADKYHLYASAHRTITGDNYVAMRHGPVGSMVLNVLNWNTEYLKPDQLDYISQHIEPVEHSKEKYKCVKDDMYYGQLSESDKKDIIKIGNMFKDTDKWDLVNLTHKYPEWAKYERDLQKDPSTSRPIPIVEMLSCLPDNDPFGFDDEGVKLSWELFSGIETDDYEDYFDWDWIEKNAVGVRFDESAA